MRTILSYRWLEHQVISAGELEYGRPAYIEFVCSQYPVYGQWVGRSAE